MTGDPYRGDTYDGFTAVSFASIANGTRFSHAMTHPHGGPTYDDDGCVVLPNVKLSDAEWINDQYVTDDNTVAYPNREHIHRVTADPTRLKVWVRAAVAAAMFAMPDGDPDDDGQDAGEWCDCDLLFSWHKVWEHVDATEDRAGDCP